MMHLKMDLPRTGCWHGRSCFVIGGGPSLRGFDFDKLKGHLAIGTNRAFEFCSPNILLAIDVRFYQWVLDGKYGDLAREKLQAYPGLKVGIHVTRDHVPGVYEIKALGVDGPIVPVERGIYHGNNSGYSAVALALAMGADPVYVLGIDLRYDGAQTHHHGGHPERTTEKDLLTKCLPPFEKMAVSPEGRKVKIVNLQWPGQNFSRLANLFDNVHMQFALDYSIGEWP